MKAFVSLLDFSSEELTEILDRADSLRQDWRARTMPQSLRGLRLGLWFYGQGFRNRVAFELGAKAMGATIAYIPGELGVHEPLEDIGPYLENWFDALVVRAKRHEDLLSLVGSSGLPIVNARTDKGHPCEIMGDLQFIRRRRGSLEGMKMVFVGETTNLCLSWLEAAARFPIEFVQIAPKDYQADPGLLASMGAKAKGSMRATDDIDEIDGTVDLVYTDCWPKPSDEGDRERAKASIALAFLPYQIRAEQLSRLKDSAFFLPCPPVTRGEEVSVEAMKSRLNLNHQAKDCLLHAQNAILEAVLVAT